MNFFMAPDSVFILILEFQILLKIPLDHLLELSLSSTLLTTGQTQVLKDKFIT